MIILINQTKMKIFIFLAKSKIFSLSRGYIFYLQKIFIGKNDIFKLANMFIIAIILLILAIK